MFAESKTDAAYHAPVLLHSSNSTIKVPASFLTDRLLFHRVEEDEHRQKLGDAYATTLLPDLRDIAVGANSCGVCERRSEQLTRICDGCKVVRYCGHERQQIDFSELEIDATVDGSESLRSIVTRCVDPFACDYHDPVRQRLSLFVSVPCRDYHDPSSSAVGPQAEPQVDRRIFLSV